MDGPAGQLNRVSPQKKRSLAALFYAGPMVAPNEYHVEGRASFIMNMRKVTVHVPDPS